MENCKKDITTTIQYYYWIPENSIVALRNSVKLDFTGKFIINADGIRFYEVRGQKKYF